MVQISCMSVHLLQPLRLVRGDERSEDFVEVAAEHGVDAVDGEADAVVGHASLREVVGADALAAVAGADLAAAVAVRRVLLLALGLVLEAGAQDFHGLFLVLEL